jgi:pimeloyl-ACP methyl ester carboxylesterase/DNA-binding CsgD family transcriptional regulator
LILKRGERIPGMAVPGSVLGEPLAVSESTIHRELAWRGYNTPAMAYPVRYARTSDGVNIAYTEFGSGEPVLYMMALPWSNFSVGLQNPCSARHGEELASFCRLVTLDPRGCGLSDHDAEDLSLDGFAHDVDAVANAIGADRFTLYGSGDASRIAIRYAATRPERVHRLVLWLPSVNSSRLRADPVMRAITPLAYRDWDTFVRTRSHAVVGGWDLERAPYADAFADLMRSGIRPDEFPRMAEAMRHHDVLGDLENVQAPTLVMTRQEAAVYTVSVVGEVAAGIPNAELVTPPGNWLMPCTNDDITREIARFMGYSFMPKPADDHEAPAELTTTNGLNNGANRLSTREREVLELIAQGKTNAEIADALVVAPATASRHVHNILNKLGMSRRAEVAVYAALAGLTAGNGNAHQHAESAHR